VADGTPAAVDFADFGRLVYPRLVGTLVLCGMAPDAAVAHVQAIVRRETREGLDGGTEATRLVVQRSLETATPPPVSRAPADAVEEALAPLVWSERLATVGRIALGDMAATVRKLPAPVALDALDDGQVRAAVDARGPAPDPELRARLRSHSVRRVLKVAIPVLLVVLVVIIVFTVLAARSPGRSESDRITEWVAVLDVGPDARSLYARAADVGKVAGVYVFVDRWACYDGFSAAAPRDRGDWFLAVGAPDRSVVEGIVQQLGRTPLTVARVEQGCAPPPPPTEVTAVHA
jgi:hypothetical protein